MPRNPGGHDLNIVALMFRTAVRFMDEQSSEYPLWSRISRTKRSSMYRFITQL